MNTDKHYLTAQIPASYEGKPLYAFLKRELCLSARKISSVKFDPDGLYLNGSRANTRTPLHTGDVLRLCVSDSENREEHILPCPMPLEILYEDDWLLALNKPSGIVCHPSRGHLKDSLASGLRAYFDETMKDAGIHLLGRLDKDTSGILLIAKNSVAGAMIRQSPPDTLKKTYLAFASGHFPEKHGVIDIPMGEARDEDGILRMVREGKPALTFYEVVGETGDFSMLKLTLGTGRTHQIRFHLSETGHPLLGDALYGQPSPLIGRTALHAETLAFTHPFSKEHLTLFAPLPEDMRRLMENC